MNLLASRGQLRASLIRWALLCVPGVMLLGFLAGQVGGDANSAWFEALTKPGIYPPPAAFGIVWTILYAMLGFALAVVCAAWGARGRAVAIVAFLLHLALNLAWTPLFFGAHEIEMALYLLVAIVLTGFGVAVLFWRVRRLAGWLMVPYLAWVCFATVLNCQFMVLNPDAGGAEPSGAAQRIEF